MKNKATYSYNIDPQDVDYTLRASIRSMLNYVLSMAGKDAAKNGFGIKDLNKNNYAWVLSRIAIELDCLPYLDESINISTWVNEWGRVITTRNFIIANENGESIGNSISQWCMLNLDNRTIVNLSDIGRVEDSSPSSIEKPHKRIDTSCVEYIKDYEVTYSDIDFNRHVNTMRYIDMMLGVLPIEIFNHKGSVRVDIHFVSESRYGEILGIKYNQKGNISFFEISHENDAPSVRARFEWR